jgi:hypothetical protein
MALYDKLAFLYRLDDEVEELSGTAATEYGGPGYLGGILGDGVGGDGYGAYLKHALPTAATPAGSFHRWCWVYLDNDFSGSSGTPLFVPFAKWNGGGDWVFTVWGDGSVTFDTQGGGVRSTSLLAQYNWHFIHAWWNGSSYYISIDNGTADSNSGSAGSSSGNDVTILAGEGGAAYFVSGKVDACGGSNVALDSGEVAELWASGSGYEIGYTDPTVTLAVDDSTIAENGGVAIVTATLSKFATREATINLALSGTATETTDYTIDDITLTIPVGSTTASATITAIDNGTDEADKTVVVDISSATNATEASPQQVTITINDDDTGGGGSAIAAIQMYYQLLRA